MQLELRPVVTELVISAQRLVEETNAVMHDKNLVSKHPVQFDSFISEVLSDFLQISFSLLAANSSRRRTAIEFVHFTNGNRTQKVLFRGIISALVCLFTITIARRAGKTLIFLI